MHVILLPLKIKLSDFLFRLFTKLDNRDFLRKKCFGFKKKISIIDAVQTGQTLRSQRRVRK